MWPRVIPALLCAAAAAATSVHVVDNFNRVPGDWRGHDGDSFGFASLAMRSDQNNASFAAVANTCNLAEINTAALKVYNEDLVARDATEAPTTAQTFEPTAAPESDAADRVALGAVVALLALVA